MDARATATYLITGAASGIGAATAGLLSGRGDRVVIADINVEAAEKLAQRLGPATIALELDVTSEVGWETVLDGTVARFGSLDVLINNAGTVETGYARDVSVARHQRTIATNFMGPLTGTLAALRRFRVEAIVTAADNKTREVFMPAEGADAIIRLGVRPDKLLEIFDGAEQFGRDVQRQRRLS